MLIYLKLSKLRVGFRINFNSIFFKNGIRRIIFRRLNPFGHGAPCEAFFLVPLVVHFTSFERSTTASPLRPETRNQLHAPKAAPTIPQVAL